MNTVKIIFKMGSNTWILQANVGDKLSSVVQRSNLLGLMAMCGVGVCGNCHVLIDDKYLPKLNEKTDNEKDFFDIFPATKHNSRLACQVVVSEDLDGMVVTIPK